MATRVRRRGRRRGRRRRMFENGEFVRNKFNVFCVGWMLVLAAVLYEEVSKLDPYSEVVRSYQMQSIYVMAILIGIHALVWLVGNRIKFGSEAMRALGVQLGVLVLAAVLTAVGYLVVMFILNVIAPAVRAFVVDIATFVFMLVILPMILLGLSARDVYDAAALYKVLFKDDE